MLFHLIASIVTPTRLLSLGVSAAIRSPKVKTLAKFFFTCSGSQAFLILANGLFSAFISLGRREARLCRKLLSSESITTLASLSGCANDARSVAELLATHGDSEPNFDVKLMTAPQPNPDGSIPQPDFSGPGVITSIGGFILTTDFQSYDQGVSIR